jgi:hypothetical protein
MSVFRVHRFITKQSNSAFADGQVFTPEQDAIWEDYINKFVALIPGYVANSGSYTYINENTMQVTVRLKAPDGKEEMYGRNYIREIGLANNQYKTAYINMRREMGESVDMSKSYWNIEYANGHVQTITFGPPARGPGPLAGS